MFRSSSTPLTREILGNVSSISTTVFYVLALLATAVLVVGIHRRVRLWRLGRPIDDPPGWRIAAANITRYVLFQRRVRGRGLTSTAHALLFGGFLVLFLGTVLIAVEHTLAAALGRSPDNPVFHKGLYFALYEVVLDAAGLAFLAGCAYFLVRRLRAPGVIPRDHRIAALLGFLLAIGLTGYLVEALRILHAQTPLPGFSFVGYLLARLLEAAGLSPTTAATAHIVAWWTHAAFSLALIAAFPWSRLLHAIAGTVRLASGVERLGTLSPVSLEEVEQTGEVGVTRVEQFPRRRLVELDACVACGRCDEQCPALEAGKPLAPRSVVQDIRHHLDSFTSQPASNASPEGPALVGEVIALETLWSCTTCSACVDVCPLGVSPLGLLLEMRRSAVAEGQLRGSPASALQKLGRSGNPWGLPAADRLAWAAGLDVPNVATHPDFEILYWVGCAAAYDRRLQRVARAVVKLLTTANVKFAVLGNLERCTGETARRIGDELLFQQLATENLATFDRFGLTGRLRRIVAHCPHCVNSLRNDYSQLGGNLDVVHHTEFLAELIRDGRLPASKAPGASETLTYHDPCYLARVGGVTEAPRQLIERSSPGQLVEMPRHGRQTACCGAGGGRMWFDDSVETRIGQGRIAEAQATEARTLAVSCPFCLTMAADGLAARGGGMEVRDVAEILADAVFVPDDPPHPTANGSHEETQPGGSVPWTST